MPIKDIETRDATLYIMNEDGTKVELGPVVGFNLACDVDEVQESIVKVTNGEFVFKATMTLSTWFKETHINNYRKLHGLPMNRNRQLMKARQWRYNSIMRRWYGSVKIGNYVWQKVDKW